MTRMDPESSGDVTEALLEWNRGNPAALSSLMPHVYDQLRRLASRSFRGERPEHTLQTTALVHEVYLRLVDQRRVSWQNRAQFFGVAAQMMRRILVDHARRRTAAKRGSGGLRVVLDAEAAATPAVDDTLVALDVALERLAAFDERQSRIVELRFFGGLSIEETADVLRVSPATVKNDWRFARAWLYSELASTTT
jgi:RNA polymerase sigma factor (TIGR02999 family)